MRGILTVVAMALALGCGDVSGPPAELVCSPVTVSCADADGGLIGPAHCPDQPGLLSCEDFVDGVGVVPRCDDGSWPVCEAP